MTENEKLRALLAEARAAVHLILDIDALQGWACEAVDDAPPVDDVLRDIRHRIDAALAEPVMDPVQAWKDANGYDDLLAAYSATITERDEARKYAEERNDEANKLQRHLNRAAQERDEARAEVERLRWGNEMACENTPTKGCACPGCGLARERAERGEDGP